MTSHVYLFARAFLAFLILFACPITQAQDAKLLPTGSISGHILVGGKGAAGIDVGAIGGDVINRRIPAAQTKTDSEGFYRLEGLAAGNYQVMTFTPHLTAAETSPDYQFSGYYSATTKGVLLAEGENVADIDIKLVRGGVITGRVTDADNKPVVEERISIEPVAEPGQRPNRVPVSIGQMYQTDDRGIYRIYGLPAGRYRVSAGRSDGQLVGSIGGFYQRTYHPDVTDPSKATIIDLIEGDEAKNVDIRLGGREDTFNISGRVVDSETGLPIASVSIGILMPQGSINFGFGMQTAADGGFAVNGVTAGHYGIYVSSENGSEFYSDPVFVDVSDKNVSGVEIKAVRGLTISGSIVSENIELKDLLKEVLGLRVSVSVMPPDGRMTPTTIRSFGYGTVGADGNFVVTGLRPGRVSLSVMSADPTKRPSIVKVSVGGVGLTQGFEIDRGQPVTGVQILVSYGTGAIRGSVTFQGAPLSNYRVQIICRRNGGRNVAGATTPDARGHFLIRQLAPGTYDCELAYMSIAGGPVGRPPASRQSVNVDNGMEADLNFLVDVTPKGVGP